MPNGTRKICPNGSTTSRSLNEKAITLFAAADRITAHESKTCDGANFRRRSSSHAISFAYHSHLFRSAAPMFSVQKFFSQDAKFFDLLEASADQTQALSRLLTHLLSDRS